MFKPTQQSHQAIKKSTNGLHYYNTMRNSEITHFSQPKKTPTKGTGLAASLASSPGGVHDHRRAAPGPS